MRVGVTVIRITPLNNPCFVKLQIGLSQCVEPNVGLSRKAVVEHLLCQILQEANRCWSCKGDFERDGLVWRTFNFIF